MRIDYDDAKGHVVSRAGVAYGLFWCAIIGARLLFTYGANHWYTSHLLHWMSTNSISADALTDGLIFMAIAMTVTRTVRLIVGHGAHPLLEPSDPGGPVMSFATVVLYAGLLILMVYRRLQGRPVGTTKQLFVTTRHRHHPRLRGLLPRQARHHRHRRRCGRLRVCRCILGRSAGHPKQAQPTRRHPLGAVGGGVGRHLRRQRRGQAGLGRSRRGSRRVDLGSHGVARSWPWASCSPGRPSLCGSGSRWRSASTDRARWLRRQPEVTRSLGL